MSAKSPVYHSSRKNTSGKLHSASGWSAWTHTTAAIRKAMAWQSKPVPTGVRCNLCNKFVNQLYPARRADGVVVPACWGCTHEVA